MTNQLLPNSSLLKLLPVKDTVANDLKEAIAKLFPMLEVQEKILNLKPLASTTLEKNG